MPPSPDAVLTLDDLACWSFAGTALAVVGHPIKHSISPAMHNAALQVLTTQDARFSDWRYFRFDIEPERLSQALALFAAKRFRGLNLTVPHKVIAFHELLAASSTGTDHALDPAARPAGAVNTLLHTPTGWHGYNTDGHGLAVAVRETLGRPLAGRPVLLLGAGGAARGAAVECLRRACSALWIANRTVTTAQALAAELAPLAGAIPLQVFDPQNLPASLPPDALVVNATSAGLHEGDPSPIDLSRLPHPAGVYDMVYNPPETALLRQARQLGLPCANGLSMLIHQGARALTLWTGAEVPLAAMRTAALGALQRQT